MNNYRTVARLCAFIAVFFVATTHAEQPMVTPAPTCAQIDNWIKEHLDTMYAEIRSAAREAAHHQADDQTQPDTRAITSRLRRS